MITSTEESTTDGVLRTIATYARALDDGRTDDVVALFTPEGTSEISGFGTFSGHEAIRSAYANLVPTQPQRHMTGNTVVSSTSSGEAVSTSDFVFFTRNESGWAVQVSGSYQDTLQWHDGRWLFSSRLTSFVM